MKPILSKLKSEWEFFTNLDYNIQKISAERLNDNGVCLIENNKSFYVIKVKSIKSKYIVKHESLILKHMAINGIGTHQLIKTKTDQDYFIFDGQVYHAYIGLRGNNLEIGDLIENIELSQNIGGYLGIFHLELLRTEIKEEIQSNPINNTDNLSTQLTELIGELNLRQDKILAPYIGLIKNHIQNLKKILKLNLPRQLIHRDIHIGNFIEFNDKLFLIDFDQTCQDYRIFEIGYFLATTFYKIWKYYGFENEIPKGKFSFISDSFLQEYNKVNPLTATEEELVNFFVEVGLMTFIVYLYQNNWIDDVLIHFKLIESIVND